jgi:membrane-associated protein
MIDFIRQAFHFVTDVQGIIQWGGTVMVCIIIFTETGLFVGFFLPGDSLLVSAGIFAAAHVLNVYYLITFGSICAVAGDQVGYLIGRKAGQSLYRREDSFFFRRKHLERAHAFYEKYGGKTIVLARFIPIVRTFAPAVAGAASMNYRRFVSYNIFGGILWVCGMVLLGFSLGSAIPDIERHIHLIIIVVVFLSILPPIVEIMKQRRRRSTPSLARQQQEPPSEP